MGLYNYRSSENGGWLLPPLDESKERNVVAILEEKMNYYAWLEFHNGRGAGHEVLKWIRTDIKSAYHHGLISLDDLCGLFEILGHAKEEVNVDMDSYSCNDDRENRNRLRNKYTGSADLTYY